MKISWCGVLTAAILLFALTKTSTAGTLYNINFTSSYSVVPTAGSFTYDPVSGFSNFLVVWDGITFNMTAQGNAPTLTASGCPSGSETPAYGFEIMSQLIPGCSTTYQWDAAATPTGSFFDFDSDPGQLGLVVPAGGSDLLVAGSWTITPAVQTVPEPGTIALMLAGLLALAGKAYVHRTGRHDA